MLVRYIKNERRGRVYIPDILSYKKQMERLDSFSLANGGVLYYGYDKFPNILRPTN